MLALPGLGGVACMVTVLLTTFALIGMALFGDRVPPLPPSAAEAAFAPVSFGTFRDAMLTMFRAFTLDGWTSAYACMSVHCGCRGLTLPALCAAAVQQLMHCDGVEYLYGNSPFARRCAFSPLPPIFFVGAASLVSFVVGALSMAVVFDAHRICIERRQAAAAAEA